MLGQFIFYDHEKKIGRNELQSMYESGRLLQDSLKRLGYTAETFEILEVGDDIYLTIDSRFDVFKWSDHRWINLYTGTFHGYNHNSQKLAFDGRLFSYRGYGYWRNHGELIEFLPKKGEWEIISATKELPFGFGVLKDSLFIIQSDDCYSVNLYSQQVNRIRCDGWNLDEIPSGHVFNFSDYTLIASTLINGEQYPLIDKYSNHVYTSTRNPFHHLRENASNSSLLYICGNQIDITLQNQIQFQHAVSEELQYYTLSDDTSAIINQIWIPIVIALVFMLYTFKRNSTRKWDNDQNSSLFESLTALENKVLDSDTIDNVLGINSIVVNETRRHRRAALIKEINTVSKSKYGAPLIVRKKNPRDKRFYLYHIKTI